ncbi:PfkB family carbohydrate kinase [Micromonospora sp. NBC_01655]|uniref:PfkB family carbohydrate kinase n=1 Tax=Micromonospora sp. NBC_01655 TaxID=2975983 RepID=UPI0022512F7A|nr:PfkB family carbohydrate kinase [Micromonospora sp. NBC_01655]MCX4469389.1 PfkB family carbohydrate kinase [Micromonospora sp. NBC_01655]
MTAGARGAASSDTDHTALVPAQHVTAINTNGAGDALLCTLAAGLAHKVPLPHAIAEGLPPQHAWCESGGQ